MKTNEICNNCINYRQKEKTKCQKMKNGNFNDDLVIITIPIFSCPFFEEKDSLIKIKHEGI